MNQQDQKQRRSAPLHKGFLSSSVPIAVCALAFVFPSTVQVVALSSATATRTTHQVSVDAFQVHAPIYRHDRDTTFSWTDEFLAGDIGSDDLDEFKNLQRSLGSEVVPSDLQRQIDEASLKPDLFLDSYLEDASLIEKVAMSTFPQQLPKPAVSALTASQQKKQTKKTFSTRRARVTPEEELMLGRQIQNGVSLHTKKTDFEAQHGREITRQEWIDLAGLESAKELRKQVSDYRSAKQRLVESNMGLVHAVVKQLGTRGGVTYEEMVQEGSLGLLRAAELFDPLRGLRFSTYATIWIKGILSNSHLKEPITLPQREKTKWNRIRQAHDSLASELGREPTRDEIANRAAMTVQEVLITTRRMTQAQQVLSLDYEYRTSSRSGVETSSEAGLQQDKAFMFDVDLAERTQFHADVVAALAKNLDAREARLMRLRYGLADGQTRSIQECADAMGLSKTRVQQLAKSCLKKLREAAEAESLQEYLLTIA
jgi:RNA polymerase sigma factor (sigma-70 family)